MKLSFTKSESGIKANIDNRVVTVKHIHTAAEILSYPEDTGRSIKQRQQDQNLELWRQSQEARRFREAFGDG